MRRTDRRSVKELALVVAFASCVYVVLILAEAHEKFTRWAANHEEWQVDEILVLLAILAVALGIFAWRRWKETSAEISRREAVQRELEYRATHDALTDLPNRVVFMDRLNHAIERATREQAKIAVLFIDLDGFKTVNDTLGHAAGDELLTQVAGRLSQSVRLADTASRIGGDEFVVLLERVERGGQVTEVVARITASLSAPFDLEKGKASVSASIGVAVGGKPGCEEDLIKAADRAMYEAKGGGGSRYEFS